MNVISEVWEEEIIDEAQIVLPNTENKKCSLVTQNGFSFTFNMVWCALFFWFTIDPDKYGDETCHSLREWGFSLAVYSLLCAITRGMIILPTLCLNQEEWMNKMYLLADAFETIIGFIFLIALTVVYRLNEVCLALRTLTFIYLVVIYLLLILIIGLAILICATQKNHYQL